MTTHDSALNALTAAVGSTDSSLATNLAEILADAIQELIEAEVTARIGAEPNESSIQFTRALSFPITRLCLARRWAIFRRPFWLSVVSLVKLGNEWAAVPPIDDRGQDWVHVVLWEG